MNILITGGAGYIGSHTAVELLNEGHKVTIVDNLINSSEESVNRIKKITGKHVKFYKIDLNDDSALDIVFEENTFDAVIHFAGLKSVSESVKNPLLYYQNNIDSTLVLLNKMQRHRINKIIFSSSATVYGLPSELPLKETSRTGFGITNPYGQTKFMVEQILRDTSNANPDMEITLLRYFNPIGAHKSGLIGEDPRDTPNNLLPYISQVAVGHRESVNVFGNDYNTPDGTGVRDYIHVVDLALGHVAALHHQKAGIDSFNLGTGKGTSVLELIHSFEKASGVKIPYKIVDRRPGDIDSCYASVDKAEKEINWKATKTIGEACEDSWRWQSQNPNGYKK